MNSCANNAHNSGLKKKKKKLYDYKSVEVGQDIDNIFVLDCVDSVSINL